jgi:hypothetical protein
MRYTQALAKTFTTELKKFLPELGFSLMAKYADDMSEITVTKNRYSVKILVLKAGDSTYFGFKEAQHYRYSTIGEGYFGIAEALQYFLLIIIGRLEYNFEVYKLTMLKTDSYTGTNTKLVLTEDYKIASIYSSVLREAIKKQLVEPVNFKLASYNRIVMTDKDESGVRVRKMSPSRKWIDVKRE